METSKIGVSQKMAKTMTPPLAAIFMGLLVFPTKNWRLWTAEPQVLRIDAVDGAGAHGPGRSEVPRRLQRGLRLAQLLQVPGPGKAENG